MTVADNVNQLTVLGAIRDGHTTRTALADHFGVEPGDYALRSAINDLEYHGHIAVDRKTGRVSVSHLWRVEENSTGTWGWSCTCGWKGDEYPDLDGAEDAAEIHVERER